MRAFTLCLARCNYEDINVSVSAEDLRTPLHLACATGNLAMAQLLIWVSKILFFISELIYYFEHQRIHETDFKLCFQLVSSIWKFFLNTLN